MNLTKLKDNFAGKALGAVGLATAAFAMPSGTVQAQDAQIQQVAAVDIDGVRLPMRDVRGLQPRGIQMSAAMASAGAQVLVFYGDDPAAFEAAKRGAKMAIAAGVPLRGMMVADPLEPEVVGGTQISGRNQIEFYAGGGRTNTIDSPERQPERVANMVQAELVRGWGWLRSHNVAVNDANASPSSIP